MPERPDQTYRQRRGYLRVLIILTAVVVMVDVAAAVLQIAGNGRTASARSDVTAGLNYEANMSSVMQYTLDAETAERGYLLTGEPSYLQPAEAAIKKAPAVLRAIRRASRADPILRRDYPEAARAARRAPAGPCQERRPLQEGADRRGDRGREDQPWQQHHAAGENARCRDERAL